MNKHRAKVNGIDLSEFKLDEEFVYTDNITGFEVLVQVISEPEKDSQGGFTWSVMDINTGETYDLSYHPNYPEYKPNINRITAVS